LMVDKVKHRNEKSSQTGRIKEEFIPGSRW